MRNEFSDYYISDLEFYGFNFFIKDKHKNHRMYLDNCKINIFIALRTP